MFHPIMEAVPQMGTSWLRLLQVVGLRWVGIIRQMYVFEDSKKSNTSEPVPKPTDFEEQNLHIKCW